MRSGITTQGEFQTMQSGARSKARPAGRVRVGQQARLVGGLGNLLRLHSEPSSPQAQSPTREMIVAAQTAGNNGAAGINFEYLGFSTGFRGCESLSIQKTSARRSPVVAPFV
jgi:hypothetical protein